MKALPFAFLCGIGFCLLRLPVAEAQLPPVPPGQVPELSPAVPAEAGAVVVSRDGTGDATLDASSPRDPFWPVGYAPKKIQKIKEKVPGKVSIAVESTPEPVRAPMWEEAGKKLDIRGISLIHDKNSKIPKYLAMVAGKLVEAGDVVSVRYDERVYRWRVVAIGEEGVSLQKMDVRGD